MRTVSACLSAGILAISFLTIAPVEADAASAMCRPGGHMHHGSSDGQPSKSAARQSAIRAWANFTDLEYGAGWSNFKRARYRSVSCHNKEAGWACNVEGNPCRSRRRRSASR